MSEALALETPLTEAPDVETSSEAYARRFAGPVGEYFLAVQAETVLCPPGWFPRARVLDVGGGHAQLAPPLAARGYQVTVAGSSEACRARLDRLPGLSPSSACDLERLPFPDRAFDVVLAFRLLTHLDGWREQARGAVPGGGPGGDRRLPRHAELQPPLRLPVLLEEGGGGEHAHVPLPSRRARCRRSWPATVSAGRWSAASSSCPWWRIAPSAGRGARAGRSGRARLLGLTRRLGSPVILRMERLEETAA